MRTLITVLFAAVAYAAQAAGPISKFDNRDPVGEYDTDLPLEDVERCLIDMEGWLAPNVYRQPDRPNRVTIIWISGGVSAGLSAARIDLSKATKGTHVVSWMTAKQALRCFADESR
ncbi:hypothetical protein LL253_08115 [Sphingobium soli]|uniref:Uncharacterized protein n=1 Tax=Sphingobium soli TaxID=1591116 RepID=A0ABS8H2J4_9SPHN|nr:hypothetical protein [Sphingobium soli]MCC4232654.1 hypothetical protein [Sphingobium soli]